MPISPVPGPLFPDPPPSRRFETRLAERWPPERWSEVTVLVAVSGGGDSVALLRALHAIRQSGAGRLLAAHYNHRLRAGSQEDADFVRRLCRELGVDVVVESAREPARRDEAASRRERYAFFRRAAARLGARYLALAHTRDDQVETVLHRLLRGTGIGGLAGIPRLRPLSEHCGLIRPLLDVGRDELRQYLKALGQPFREDPSNQDPAYTRNRLRHELLPHLAEHYNPDIRQALARLALLAEECSQVVGDRVRELAEHCVRSSPGSVRIATNSLVGQSRYLIRELVMDAWTEQQWPKRDMGFAQWDALAGMVLGDPQPRRRHFPGGILAERQPEALLLRSSLSRAP